jgi:hypothetical protein
VTHVDQTTLVVPPVQPITPVPSVSPAPAAPVQPERLQVSAKEFELDLSRPIIRSGAAVVQFVNFGEDPHDLQLVRDGGAPVRFSVAQPGEVLSRDVVLAPGRYRVFCSLPGHEALGMHESLVVGG